MNYGIKTKRMMAIAALTMGLLVGAFGCPESGRPAEDFSLQPVGGGKAVNLSALKGKPTLVIFWATWCPPCRREVPVLKELYVKYGTRLNMLGVAVNFRQTQQDVATFGQANGIQYPLLWDADNTAADHYCVSGIPSLVLVDSQGIVRYRGNAISSTLVQMLDEYTAKSS
jgi:thiol-disulfide isomerase/thioredoxin